VALYQEAPCALLLTDRIGTILHANRTCERWLGAEPGALSGKRFQELLTVGGRIFHQTHWSPLLQMQGSIAEVKLELRHADGSVLPFMMNAVSREHDGAVIHEIALFMAQDRVAYERELMLARRQAEELLAVEKDRALLAEQMVGIVSHDLRSPLNALTLGIDLLGRSSGQREQEQVLGNLGRSVRRARRLIDDLLDFTMARIGQGLNINRREVDVHAAVASHVRDLALAHSNRRLRHESIGAGMGSVDGDRLFQVVSNLVANAAAYGQADAPITVCTHVGAEGFEVSVHNLGQPIPPDARERLFKPMVRGVDDAGPHRSVGLGLYIVSEIARAHGGSVRVASEAESGTTFTVSFPTT
jgi:sigma-B regulation protein RsbU (phosphoserine phosphatase)